LGGNFKAPN